jgi:hypothetical protein
MVGYGTGNWTSGRLDEIAQCRRRARGCGIPCRSIAARIAFRNAAVLFGPDPAGTVSRVDNAFVM